MFDYNNNKKIGHGFIIINNKESVNNLALKDIIYYDVLEALHSEPRFVHGGRKIYYVKANNNNKDFEWADFFHVERGDYEILDLVDYNDFNNTVGLSDGIILDKDCNMVYLKRHDRIFRNILHTDKFPLIEDDYIETINFYNNDYEILYSALYNKGILEDIIINDVNKNYTHIKNFSGGSFSIERGYDSDGRLVSDISITSYYSDDVVFNIETFYDYDSDGRLTDEEIITYEDGDNFTYEIMSYAYVYGDDNKLESFNRSKRMIDINEYNKITSYYNNKIKKETI